MKMEKIKMRFNIHCNQCDNIFYIETDNSGTQKCRCPYCKSILTCNVDIPDTPQKKQPKQIIPIAETSPIKPHATQLSEVSTTIIEQKPANTKDNHKKQQTTNPTSDSQSKGLIAKIKRFQAQNKNGDLWVFFIGAFLFMFFIVIIFHLVGELAMLFSDIYDKLFKEYIEIKNTI